MGLVSDGGVHSHMSHIFALIKFAKQSGLDGVYVHCFLDGRDVHPTSGLNFVSQIDEEIKKLSFGKIATICGRMYAMGQPLGKGRKSLRYADAWRRRKV